MNNNYNRVGIFFEKEIEPEKVKSLYNFFKSIPFIDLCITLFVGILYFILASKETDAVVKATYVGKGIESFIIGGIGFIVSLALLSVVRIIVYMLEKINCNIVNVVNSNNPIYSSSNDNSVDNLNCLLKEIKNNANNNSNDELKALLKEINNNLIEIKNKDIIINENSKINDGFNIDNQKSIETLKIEKNEAIDEKVKTIEENNDEIQELQIIKEENKPLPKRVRLLSNGSKMYLCDKCNNWSTNIKCVHCDNDIDIEKEID